MNSYLRGLIRTSEGVARQFYKGGDRLPPYNPYGRDYFAIPQTPKAEHMYPTIILVKATGRCQAGCAFCFRQNEMRTELTDITEKEIRGIFGEYVPRYNAAHGAGKIRELLLTGGDPFLLQTNLLECLLKSARESGIEYIRIGSRATSISPHLVTDGLVGMLRDYLPLVVVGCYNHADELTPESLEATDRILNTGIGMKSQSVLLRGVNDTVESLDELFWKLNTRGIQPYRLYHCMPVGPRGLRTTVREGMELTRRLQEEMGGTIGHFDFGIATPFGKICGPTEADILDEKSGAELAKMLPGEPFYSFDPKATYLKLRVTSRTTKEGEIPKEVWYRDGERQSKFP